MAGVGETVFKETLRAMAWERAKGELRAMLHTYWDEKEAFEPVDKLVTEFLKEMADYLS